MGRVFGPTGNNASAKYNRTVRIPFNVSWWRQNGISKMNPDKDENDLDLVNYINYAATAGWLPSVVTAVEKDREFADDTTVNPSSAGAPTLGEIETFATAAGITYNIVYYTGTDTATDSPTRVYHIDASGTATLIFSV